MNKPISEAEIASFEQKHEDAYRKQIEAFESTYWFSDLMHGAIPICHEGCALRIWLIVSGKQAGKLWQDRRSEYKGLRPVRLFDGSQATFSEWYKEWLDNCFANANQPKDDKSLFYSLTTATVVWHINGCERLLTTTDIFWRLATSLKPGIF